MTLHGLDGPATSIAWNADGTRLAVAVMDGGIVLFDVERAERLRRARGPVDMVLRLAWSADEAALVAVDGAGNVVQLDPGTLACAVTDDRRSVVRSWLAGGLDVVDVATTQTRWALPGPPASRLAVHSAAGVLAAGRADGSVALIDLASGAVLHALDCTPDDRDALDRVPARDVLPRSPFVALSADGRLLATWGELRVRDLGTGMERLRLWDTSSGRVVAEVPRRFGWSDLRTFLPDGRSVLFLREDADQEPIVARLDAARCRARCCAVTTPSSARCR